MGIDFCTVDGKRLYPRIRSKFIDEKAYLTFKTLELQVGAGLSWKRRFIPWDEPNKVYMYQKGEGNSRLYTDENGNFFIQTNMGSPLVKVESKDELTVFAKKDKKETKHDIELLKNSYKHCEYYPVDNVYTTKLLHGKTNDKIRIEKNGIWHVEDNLFHENYWVDPITQRKHYTRPVILKRGFVNILKEGDWCYVRNIQALKNKPLKQWEIVADNDICVIDNEFLFLKKEPHRLFKVYRRTDDFTYFVVKEYNEYKNMDNEQEIRITQFKGEGLKIKRV